MFKEVLHIQPKLDSGDLNRMENSLNSRFAKIGKKFGKGLLGIIAGGGIGAIGLSLVEKLLNPLKEVQDAIEKTLHAGDDLADQAEQFGTTAGALAKLQAFGKVKGIDPDTLAQLITKFQGKVAEAALDPNKESAVRQFVGQKDSAQAFLSFMEGLSRLNKSDRNKAIAVEEDVFGARQRGKVANFINADFKGLDKTFEKFSPEELTKANEKNRRIGERLKTGQAANELQDQLDKSKVLSEGVADALVNKEAIDKQRENQKIAQAPNLAKLQEVADTLIAGLEGKLFPLLGQGVGVLTDGVEHLRRIANSPLLNRMLGSGKGDK